MNREIFYTHATAIDRLSDLIKNGATVNMHTDRQDGHWVAIIEWRV